MCSGVDFLPSETLTGIFSVAYYYRVHRNERLLEMTVATLEERVNSHIKFFWGVVAIGGTWLAGISALLFSMNGTLARVERAKADDPFKITTTVLASNQHGDRNAVGESLKAVTAILKSSRTMKLKPDREVMARAANAIVNAQKQYPDLPATWEATATFINYKSTALLGESSPSGIRGKNCEERLAGGGWEFSNCETSLEQISSHIRGTTVRGKEAPFTFRKCIIHYSGGEIPAKELNFIDSIFEIHLDKAPGSPGASALRQLALATTDRVAVVL